MHGLVTLFAAGEPSKTPLYIAGALLAGWAVVLSAIGMRSPDFPGSVGRQRGVIALTAILVAGVIVAAVAVAAIPEKKQGERAEAPKPQGAVPPPSAGPGAPPPPAAAPAAPPAAPKATVEIAADPSGQLAYTEKTATAKAGKVTIDFTNQSPVPHDVTIEGAGKKLGGTPVINASKATASITLKPGTYTFYCSVDSHRQAGMQGTLTVQ